MRAGIAAANANDLDGARRDFARAVTLAPQVEAAHAALGAVLLAQGELKSRTGRVAARARVGSCGRLRYGEPCPRREPAGRCDRRGFALRAGPCGAASADAFRGGGHCVCEEPGRVGQSDAAEEQLRAALERTPESAPLHEALGVLLARAGHTDQALPHFERAAALDPSLPQTQYLLGTALLALGRPEEAVAPLQRAVAATPESFDGHLQLGRALSAIHRDREALVELHRAAELRGPDDAAVQRRRMRWRSRWTPAEMPPVRFPCSRRRSAHRTGVHWATPR